MHGSSQLDKYLEFFRTSTLGRLGPRKTKIEKSKAIVLKMCRKRGEPNYIDDVFCRTCEGSLMLAHSTKCILKKPAGAIVNREYVEVS